MHMSSSLRMPVASLYQPSVNASAFVRGFIVGDTRGSAAGMVLAVLIVAAFSGAFYPVDLPAAYRATFP